ncbi:unnamed protein product [Effrenium voratum]|nr:unnamed protein product [Effrenium voratum]
MGAAQSQSDAPAALQVGGLLRLWGTGPRWEGRQINAKIADIRKSDDTVKVEYLIGGFKRFPRTKLEELIVKRPSHSHSIQDFQAGQHLVLHGFGPMDSNVAVVVDIQESDETVRVRYINGEFKRFSVPELELTMSEQAPASWEKWSVGQHIYLSGSGKWWTGSCFAASIVDIRHSDSTIKVQYTSGGFKRFPMAEFKQLVTEQRLPERLVERRHARAQRA